MFWWNREVSPGIRVGFTDTGAGNLAFHVGGGDPLHKEAVSRNRARLQRELGCGAGPVRFMNQVHGSTVFQVRGVDASGSQLGYAGASGSHHRVDGLSPAQGAGQAAVPTADAMVSVDAALAVLVADCVPVVLLGERACGGPVLAVAHAGRAGVAAKVVLKTVAAMRDRGAVRIRAWLGPSVCGNCYEVPAQLRDEVAAVEPSAFAATSRRTPALDLPAGVMAQLAAEGVLAERVPGCTMEEPDLFSHRRDTARKRPQGRFAGVIYVSG
ncbi:polyphenol oxidase family protein [Arthrobacter sp. H14-L1]|uniref:polyphenol oxidase family protein n=1 Tax=Arthrobacter sp. H14-L1 TaxID=2996697 RepID=UPI00226F6539|nr:polyphenol oxidase family protein [Arthrobacter sp. H14-L1]MCY0904246.1 polyphenol oxidase family protein [Arthrobacter sp. H14-L1]